MFIYNVTINIDNDVREEWLQWMKEFHIPNVLNTGFFTGYRIFRVMVDEEKGTTYSIQYSCESLELYHRYQKEQGPRMQQEVKDKYEGKFVAFRTVLEAV